MEKIKVDITTWCSTNNKAAVSLKKILEDINDKKLVKYVGAHLSRFFRITKDLSDIKNTKTRKHLMTLVYKQEIESIVKKKYEISVETHLRNIIHTTYLIRYKNG